MSGTPEVSVLSGLALATLQVVLAARVTRRLIRTGRGTKIAPSPGTSTVPCVGVIVPVLNEANRLTPCLEGLIQQGPIVGQIVVADGGSHDGTQQIVARYASVDPRIRLVHSSACEPGRNGKANNLQFGLAAIDPALPWVLTIDADVRPGPDLASSLIAHADQERLTALSVATRQCVSGWAEALLHPAMLATLVYRFGIPGHATSDRTAVQANGQCFLIRRDVLATAGGFATVLDSVCEDVTLARLVAESGKRVGFYETATDDLVQVAMYESAPDAWRNWLRSLPMRDRFWGMSGLIGIGEVLLVQAGPLPISLLFAKRTGPATLLRWLNLVLLAIRIGVLFGTARAYLRRPWTYWLSPVCDVPVAIGLLLNALRRVHHWRGHLIVRGEPQ